MEPSQTRETGKVVGVDFGTARIGVAVSDPERRIAFPLEIWRHKTEKLDLRHFQELVVNERITRFVVGLPLHCNGDASEKSRQATEFGAKLAEATGVPVDYVDERFTSVIAEETLRSAGLNAKKRKEKLDAVAAQIILTTYLERGCVGTTRPEPLDDNDATP